jgi:SAM-dependent methyltransferase
MSLQSYYEDSYQSEKSRSTDEKKDELILSAKALFHYVVESKNRFLPDMDWKDIKVLELGSGRGGLGILLARLGAQVTLVDFSPTALSEAEYYFSLEGLEVKLIEADVTHPDLNFKEKYHLIIDSHLLHCLTQDPERVSYYRLVLDHLASNGVFVAETMVHRKKLFIPDGFMFDEKNILWQMFGKWTPIRRILDSLDLEAELQNAGFNIIYFYYYGQYGFVPHRSFMDIPPEILPAAVRMVVQKKRD